MTSAVPVAQPTVLRIAIAVVAAGLLGRAAWILADPRLYTPDFHFYWRAARLWSAGIDPYAMRPRAAFWKVWPLWDRLFYPMPALLLTGPFATLGVRMGQAVFIGSASGFLAWRLTRETFWPLFLFLTPSFWVAAWLGQWSPWLTLGALVPSAGFLLAAKPTLGLACWLYRPTWRAFWSGVAIMAVSLLVMPRWPLEWLDNLHTVQRHPAPILAPGGFLLALAALRWRQPEARFLLAMACVPQLLFFADQLPLFLVARTRREAVFLVAAGLTVFGVWLAPLLAPTGNLGLVWPYAMLGCYLPALYVVLRRPNA